MAAAPKTKIIASLALMLALSPAAANAAITDSAPLPPEQQNQSGDPCQRALNFGLKVDSIPAACDAHLVKAVDTATGRKEKWKYRDGYLFFENGVLMATRVSP